MNRRPPENNDFSGSIAISIILFLIAFLPRSISLGTFLTADERPWINRSLNFFNAVSSHESSNAMDITTVGWGEGLDLASRYLNEKPNAKNPIVAAQYPGFDVFFKGRTVGMNATPYSDYIVFYICAIQRKCNWTIWKRYEDQSSEKIILINNINYCCIYKTKRLV